MSALPEPKPSPTNESEVWNAISAFEQILEAMPQDRVALETLYEAYEQIGQKAQAAEYLVRLAESVADEEDAEAAPDLIGKLRGLGSEDPAVERLVERLQVFGGAPATPREEPEAPAAEELRSKVTITGELSLAWTLLQAGQLTQDEYSEVVQDLSESSTTDEGAPVTLLAALEELHPEHVDKVVEYMAKDASTPFVNLGSFDLDEATPHGLPLPFSSSFGAICFGQLGNSIMVAVQNPYDQELRKLVEEELQRSCHYFLTNARIYRKALETLRERAHG